MIPFKHGLQAPFPTILGSNTSRRQEQGNVTAAAFPQQEHLTRKEVKSLIWWW